MDAQRLARLIVADASCFLAFWIARLAVPWWFGIAALVILNIALQHRNQRLFRVYHGLQTCLLIIYLALTAGRHTLQELIAILLLAVLFEVYFWLAGNFALAAESPVHFLRIAIIACCYTIFGNTDPLIPAVVLVVMLASSMLSAVTTLDPNALKRLIPGFVILVIVFAAAVASPIMRAPTLPTAAVWLVPGTPSSTPVPSGTGTVSIVPPVLTLRRILQDHFWELFGFMYVPLAFMSAMLAAAMIISISVLHNTWRKTIRLLIFPISLVTTAFIFTIIYTGTKTAQILNSIGEAGRLGIDNFNDIVDLLRTERILPDKQTEVKPTLEAIAAAIYWIGSSLLLISLVASVRDMVFEFRHEVLLSLLERSDRKKTIRAIRGLISMDQESLLQDPVTSITALFALGVETIAQIGPRLKQGETATEFAQRVVTEVPACSSDLTTLADLFVKARYTPSSVGGEDVLTAKKSLQELKVCVRNMRNEKAGAQRQTRRQH